MNTFGKKNYMEYLTTIMKTWPLDQEIERVDGRVDKASDIEF